MPLMVVATLLLKFSNGVSFTGPTTIEIILIVQFGILYFKKVATVFAADYTTLQFAIIIYQIITMPLIKIIPSILFQISFQIPILSKGPFV